MATRKKDGERTHGQPGPEVERGILRAIDASLNRAREAARVVEDVARFVENDGASAAWLKGIRHDLGAVERIVGRSDLLAARDTQNDEGRGFDTRRGVERHTPQDVTTANLRRLQEALRSLEELTKLDWERFNTGRWAELEVCFEDLRHRAYEVEQRMMLGAPRRALARGGVMLLVTRSLCRKTPAEVMRGAVAAGIRCFQLREKEGTDRERHLALVESSGELVAEARKLLLTKDQQARYEDPPVCIIFNDRVDMARACVGGVRTNCHGVHVGPDDLWPGHVKLSLGSLAIVGSSARDPAMTKEALMHGADYLGAGAMFPSETKPGAKVAGPAWAVKATKLAKGLPVFAIGGITLENAHILKEAGIRRIAVCSAICSAKDPKAAAKALVKLFPDLDEGEHIPTESNGNRFRPSVIRTKPARSRAK